PTIANASPGPVRTTFSSALSRRTFFDALSAALGAAAVVSPGAAAGAVADVESSAGAVESPPMGSAGCERAGFEVRRRMAAANVRLAGVHPRRGLRSKHAIEKSLSTLSVEP